MARFRILIFALISFVLLTSGASSRNDLIQARQNNVCKILKEDVLLYFVFIDTRTTAPWTEFDILTTIDSIYVAERWIEEQAKKAGVNLNIKTDYYIGNEYTTINRSLPKKTIQESLSEPNPERAKSALNRWGDYVAKTIGASLYIKEKDGIPKVKTPANRERLVAFLRDEYSVESVALMFFINNYFNEDVSVVMNQMETEQIEFAIVSYKYPAEIAHYFVKLFGGLDLYKSDERRSGRKVKKAAALFPNDIMQDPKGRDIRDLEIGPVTGYMVGWSDNLSSEYLPFLTDGLF